MFNFKEYLKRLIEVWVEEVWVGRQPAGQGEDGQMVVI